MERHLAVRPLFRCVNPISDSPGQWGYAGDQMGCAGPEAPASCVSAPYSICLLESAIGTLGVRKLSANKKGNWDEILHRNAASCGYVLFCRVGRDFDV